MGRYYELEVNKCKTITELVEYFESLRTVRPLYSTDRDELDTLTLGRNTCDYIVVNFPTDILNILLSENNTPSIYDLSIIHIANYIHNTSIHSYTKKYRNTIGCILLAYKNRKE